MDMQATQPLRCILLPGLDGTGQLFERFLAVLPPDLAPDVVAYPADRPLGYDDLIPLVEARLPRDEPFAIVAESFSGPLAIRIAARRPPGLVALVLVATFVQHPVPWLPAALAPLARPFLFRLPPFVAPIRWFLAGENGDELAAEVARVVRRVAPAVIARRVREALTVDARAELAAVAVPILIVSARRDRLLGPGAARSLARLRPDAAHCEIDAPHMLLQRRPREAADAVAPFLRSLGPP
ncbi:alpha/beta fold hydrolase [Prosthecodimorpha staleyi]|uniref:Alpha/beta hydrolase n=1 Tax=Prosthecodimorpha staleyi TaxID=2840188 RepID=A0A947DA60_9HYPH|nr:alpha/beta hydrolase [Prosthecodimorpha staleyi]MBT9291247.1 alpha/beta hydrolase [Prosthecodimorpha staleyi]